MPVMSSAMAGGLQFDPPTQFLRKADTGRISGSTNGFLPRRSSHIDGGTSQNRWYTLLQIYWYTLVQILGTLYCRLFRLNLVTAAIALWNTVSLDRIIKSWKEQGRPVDQLLLQNLSPLGWEHINLTGDYVWRNRFKGKEGIQSAQTATDSLTYFKIRFLKRPQNPDNS